MSTQGTIRLKKQYRVRRLIKQQIRFKHWFHQSKCVTNVSQYPQLYMTNPKFKSTKIQNKVPSADLMWIVKVMSTQGSGQHSYVILCLFPGTPGLVQRLTFYIEITVLVSFDISLRVCVYLGRVQRRSYKRVRISQVLWKSV